MLVGYFNPRTLQESATTNCLYQCVITKDFNPRTLQESATSPGQQLSGFVPNFNPRTLQESATPLYQKRGRIGIISIHAPYKRVRPQYIVKK